MNSSTSILRNLKKCVLHILPAILVLPTLCCSQNLVPNPSFEQHSGCPNNWGQINLANSWTTPSSGSPDYFDSCSTVPEFDVPLNIQGYSAAHTGNAYAGIITWSDTITYSSPLVVEYVQAQLTAPLVAGQCYRVSFWTSCTEGTASLSQGDPIVVGMSSLISAYLSATPPSSPGFGVLPIAGPPQITSPVTIDDTSQWTLVTGIFTAQGGEQYITIGNWNMGVYGNGPPHSNGPFEPCTAYYFVDDVEVIPIPQVNLGADDWICPGETITLNADPNATSFVWSTGEITSSITVNSSGTYWVQQTSGPCVQTDTIIILDDNCSQPTPTPSPACSFYIPNAFTPNRDARNDGYGPEGESITEYHIMIFNRWGQKVYESYDMGARWDGTFQGQLCQEDVYVYTVDYRCNSEPKHEFGHVVLLK